MADNKAFSPKEFKVFILDQTGFNASVAGTGMYQLDVDSISMPSLNNYQSLDVRDGRTFESKDFSHDRTLTIKELTLTGTMHDDDGHKFPIMNLFQMGTKVFNKNLLLSSTLGNKANDIIYHGAPIQDHELFTIVIASPDVTSGKNLELIDCTCTNFQLSAGIGDDGGLYKFSATFQTGSNGIDLDDATDVISSFNTYANTTTINMGNIAAVSDTDDGSAGTGLLVFGKSCALQSFNVNIDHPASFVGAGATGFQSVTHAKECSVTFDAQIKYDAITDELIKDFDTQTAVTKNASLISAEVTTFGGTIPKADSNDSWVDETIDGSQNATLTQNTTTGYDKIRNGTTSGKVDLEDTSGYLSYKRTDYVIGTRYHASLWINESAASISTVTMHAGTTVRSSINDSHTHTLYGVADSGQSADGWELIETDFTATATTMYVILRLNGDSSGDAYIDDFYIREAGEGLWIQNSDGCNIFVGNYVITNVALSEGDIMMLDVSGKAVDNGVNALAGIRFNN